MAQVVKIDDYLKRKASERGFSPWKERFKETYNGSSMLADLSDKTLYYLADSEAGNQTAYCELIMGILDLGCVFKFRQLENRVQLQVTDIQLYLSDRIRFELMRRLRWLSDFSGANLTIVELVSDFEKLQFDDFENPPQLASDHPEFDKFKALIKREQNLLVRKLYIKAMKAFRERIR